MLNLSALTPFTGNRSRRGRPQRRRAGLEVLGAFNASSQMALLYPPGVDELVRREFDRVPTADRRAGAGR
jgi:hypothetical protein